MRAATRKHCIKQHRSKQNPRNLCSERVRRILFVIVTSLVLLNCSTEESQQVSSNGTAALKILHAFPHDGQYDVAPDTTIAIKFNQPIDPDSLAPAWKFIELGSGKAVSGELRIIDADNTLVQFRATQVLHKGARYRYSLTDLKADQEELPFKNISQSFTVLSDYSAQFAVRNIFPDDPFPFVDFSPIYVNFTRRLDTGSVSYGSTVKLLDEQQQLVPARISPNKHRLTIDPIDDLTAGHHYILQLAGVKDYNGVALAPFSREFVPLGTAPRAKMPLDIVDLIDDNGQVLNSPFFEQRVNSINMDSVLLGRQTLVPLSGGLIAELAYVVEHPDFTPFVIRRGGEIQGEEVAVKLGNRIPSGFKSGDLTLSVLNDAVGYMYKNNINDDKYAPRSIIMMFDAGIHMSEPQANAMITQSALHTELTGTAEVKDGALEIDVITILENDVFRISTATASLNFHLRAPDVITNQTLADRVATTTREKQAYDFKVLSAYPAHQESEVNPDDDLTLYFNGVPDIQTLLLPGAISLQRIADSGEAINPEAIDFQLQSSGTGIRIIPSRVLAYNSRYQLTLESSIRDIHDNSLATPQVFQFETQWFDDQQQQPATVQLIFPGFPCALTDIDLANNKAGRCLGGLTTDDNFDIFKIASNRSIHVLFSRPILQESISHSEACDEGSVRVERINEQGECLNAVAGDYIVKNRYLQFIPHHPWEKGQLYRLSLISDGSNIRCDAGEICSAAAEPLPLNTDPLNFSAGILGAGSKHDIGGPPMVIHFRGDDYKRAMFLPLFVQPGTDVNGNGKWDAVETPHVENSIAYQVTATEGEINGANIGCKIGAQCAEFKNTAFLNGGLAVDVNGFDESLGYMPIDLFVTSLAHTKITFFAKSFDGLINLQIGSGTILFRKRAIDSIIATGLKDTGINQPFIELKVPAYIDTPYLNILGGLVNTNLHSLETQISVAGPLEFLPDGRLSMELTNLEPVELALEMRGVSEEELNQVFNANFDPLTNLISDIMEKLLGEEREIGKIHLTIPKGDIHLRLVGGTLQ